MMAEETGEGRFCQSGHEEPVQALYNGNIPRGSFLRGPEGFLEDFLRLPMDDEQNRELRPVLEVLWPP